MVVKSRSTLTVERSFHSVERVALPKGTMGETRYSVGAKSGPIVATIAQREMEPRHWQKLYKTLKVLLGVWTALCLAAAGFLYVTASREAEEFLKISVGPFCVDASGKVWQRVTNEPCPPSDEPATPQQIAEYKHDLTHPPELTLYLGGLIAAAVVPWLLLKWLKWVAQ